LRKGTDPALAGVADVLVDDAEQRDDGGLVGGDAVEIAHLRISRNGGLVWSYTFSQLLKVVLKPLFS
jgi:hypothetical protein